VPEIDTYKYLKVKMSLHIYVKFSISIKFLANSFPFKIPFSNLRHPGFLTTGI